MSVSVSGQHKQPMNQSRELVTHAQIMSWSCHVTAPTENLSGTVLGTQRKLVTSVIQQGPIVQATKFLITKSHAIVYKHG